MGTANRFNVLLLVIWSLAQGASATVLSDLAASMQPGTWAKFSPSNKSVVTDASNWAGFSNSAAWDPTSKQFIYWGDAGHGVNYRFMFYTDSDGAWSLGPPVPAPMLASVYGHAWDQETIDPATGRFYLLQSDGIATYTDNQYLYRFDIAKNIWTKLPDPPIPGGGTLHAEVNSLTWFPDRQSVVMFRQMGNRQVWEFKESTQAEKPELGTWTEIGSLPDRSKNYYFTEYSEKCHCIVIFNISEGTIFQMDASGVLTQAQSRIPANAIYTGSGWWMHSTTDPVTGDIIVLSDGTAGSFGPPLTVWIYDPVTDTWTEHGAAPREFVGGMVGTPVSTYGVILYATCGEYTGCDADMWVYKHSGATSPPLVSADADFQARCAASGVIMCEGFNNTTTDIVQGENLFPSNSGAYLGTLDTSIKSSGAGSLKFTLPVSPATADISGSWVKGWPMLFSENSGTFYVQFRQRFSPEMFSNLGQWNSAWKQVILHHNTATCAGIELTTGIKYSSMPAMYTSCGGSDNSSISTSVDGSTWRSEPPLLIQQGENDTSGYNCAYKEFFAGAGDGPGCYFYQSDIWITFYYEITTANWCTDNMSAEQCATTPGYGWHIKAYVAPDGQPYRQWTNVPNQPMRSTTDDHPEWGFNRITLTPYMTGLSVSGAAEAQTWYDELIVSTRPIAAPGAVSVGNQDTTAPQVSITSPSDGSAVNCHRY
jgi:hypothetical protein